MDPRKVLFSMICKYDRIFLVAPRWAQIWNTMFDLKYQDRLLRKWGGNVSTSPPHSVDLSWRHCFSSKNNQNHSFCAEFHELSFKIIRIEKSYVENPQKTIQTALGRSKWDSESSSAQEIQYSAVLWCTKRHISESFIISTLSERIWNASFEFCDTYYQVYGSWS